MNKNIHDTDDFFKSAYQQFEDTPSDNAWEKINAGLDKKEADSNKRKFIFWRRTTIFLLLLTTGLILFNSGVFKTGPRRSAGKTINHKYQVSLPEKQAQNNEEIRTAEINNIKKDELDLTGNSVFNNNFSVKQNNITRLDRDTGTGKKLYADRKRVNDHLLPAGKQYVISTSGSKPGQNEDELPEMNEYILPKKMMANNLTEKDHITKPITTLSFNKMLFPLLSINNNIEKRTTEKNKKGEKKSFHGYWLLSTYASYDRANYKLDSDFPGNITSIKHGEDHEPSFSGGVLATRQFTKHWGLQTGLLYSHTAIGISPQKLYALQNPAGGIAFKYITSSGYAYIKPGLGIPPSIGDSVNTTEGKHTLKIISIPLMIKYAVSKNKLSIVPGAGIEANFLTGAKVETEIEMPFSPEIVFINKLDGAQSFYLSIIADAELRYKLNKKLSLNLRPVFRYALSPISKNNVVETFPYSFGLGFGITHKF